MIQTREGTHLCQRRSLLIFEDSRGELTIREARETVREDRCDDEIRAYMLVL